MWSDNETAVDLLGYKHLVIAVAGIVRNERLLPATIGVFGDWGGGKSSLLKMVEEQIVGDEDALILTFNGWLFEGYEDAKSALIGVILDEIASKRTLDDKAKATWSSLIRRVNWFRVAGAAAKHGTAFALGGPAGLGFTMAADLSAYVKQAAEKLATGVKELDLEEVGKFFVEQSGQEARKAVREFRNDFQTLLDQTNIKRLVVLIDDLDRCLPDAIIEILEAIKLFLFVPRTAFVIGADERLIRYAVRRRFPELPGDSTGVANEYLEKLIQYPVRIPALDSAEMETYINLLFASSASLLPGEFEKVRQHVITSSADSFLSVRFNSGVAHTLLNTVPEELKTQLSMAQRIAPVLASGLKGNPRQCKRFMNALVMRVGMGNSLGLDVQERVLAKLMLLEYLKPEWFRRLAEVQVSGAGKPAILRALESTRAQSVEIESETDEKPRPRKSTKNGKTASSPNGGANRGDSNSVAIPPEFAAWREDGWMVSWLESEPALAGIDLRPYFYFSRDRLGSLSTIVSRLSPAAQDTVQKLLHQSDAQRQLGLRDASKLSDADAAAVFETLTERVEQSDNLRDDPISLPILLEWCGARKELRSQLVALLSRLPVAQLPVSVPLKVVELVQGTEANPAGRQLLDRWSKDTSNTSFARAASSALTRLSG